MALSKKPNSEKKAVISEAQVEALINKGGQVPKREIAEKTEADGRKVLKSGLVPVQLRVAPEVLDNIDALIAQRLVPVSRHVWLMEAVQEKILREKGQ